MVTLHRGSFPFKAGPQAVLPAWLLNSPSQVSVLRQINRTCSCQPAFRGGKSRSLLRATCCCHTVSRYLSDFHIQDQFLLFSSFFSSCEVKLRIKPKVQNESHKRGWALSLHFILDDPPTHRTSLPCSINHHMVPLCYTVPHHHRTPPSHGASLIC